MSGEELTFFGSRRKRETELNQDWPAGAHVWKRDWTSGNEVFVVLFILQNLKKWNQFEVGDPFSADYCFTLTDAS
jgi:hypothetical protein